MPNSIYIIAFVPFPEGGAFTNRVKSLSKGLYENGYKVKILIPTPTLNPKRVNKEISGNINGVKFEYLTGMIKKKKITKFFNYILAVLKVYKTIHKNKTTNMRVLLMASNSKNILPFILIKWITGVNIYFENSEFPAYIIQNKKSKIIIVLNNILEKFLYKSFKGIFPISSVLEDYYAEKISKKCVNQIINITVDTERFANINVPLSSKKYIAYCGNPDIKKEGVDILIKSFSKISNKFPDIYLYIIGGDLQSKMLMGLKQIAMQCGVIDKVVFTGNIQNSLVPQYLVNAIALTLARPKSKQAEGGFPTKLGEYLASGRPVIVTSVGDIPLFLKDGYNAYVANPNDINSFAEKMAELLDDKQKADIVGNRGKELIKNEFNYKIQAAKIIEVMFN